MMKIPIYNKTTNKIKLGRQYKILRAKIKIIKNKLINIKSLDNVKSIQRVNN